MKSDAFLRKDSWVARKHGKTAPGKAEWRRGNELEKKRVPGNAGEPAAFCGGGEEAG